MITLRVSTKSWVIIPAGIRKQLGLKPGMKLAAVPQDNGLNLRILNKKYFEDLAGILGTKGELLKGLLRERELDLKREDRKSR